MARALITGASSGIGYELAHVFAREGYDLIITARSTKKLHALKKELEKKYGVGVTCITQDLTAVGAAKKVHAAAKKCGSVDVLINNAGFGSYGTFVDTDLAHERDMITVNVSVLTELAKLFLRDMQKRGSGKILNVASTAAFQPGPLMAVYFATKAYVLSLSEALFSEVAGTGIVVSALCPGPVPTNFAKVAGASNSKLFESSSLDARTVAEIGYKGLVRNKRVIIPGTINKVLAWSSQIMPRALVLKVIRHLQRSRH